ncbi:MAG: hypothetical protein ACYTEQ_27015 [Planctomycetota bacterium]|jgi:hypothetical protein
MPKVMLLRTDGKRYLIAPAVPHDEFKYVWIEDTARWVMSLAGLEVVNT